MRATLALLLVARARPQQTSQRETASFSRSWRWHYGPGGDDAGAGPGNEWASAFSAISSIGTSASFPDPHRVTGSDCATACAYDPFCVAWLHDPAGRACTHGVEGVSTTPAKTNATTIGGVRAAATPLQTSYSFGAASLPEADTWPLVDAPHDALFSLNGSFSESGGDERHGYRVRTVVWYRKTFALPAEWSPATAGGATFIRFEGILHFSQLWLNGVYLGHHASSYGEFTVRLDNVSGVVFGGGPNVIAVRADASYGSGHWYEGGGLIREIQIVHVGDLNFVENGVWIPPELPADSTSVVASAEFQNLGSVTATASVRFSVFDSSGALIANATTAPVTAPAGDASTVIATVSIALPGDILLWSLASPTLYTVTSSLFSGAQCVDVVNVTVGFRRVKWDSDTGFYLNGEGYRLRGFSHHNSFAGVGVAMPPRLDLFRAQVSRALGSNVWRMSHNPYRTPLYDILDNLGISVWDENRDFGPAYSYQMGEMVKRGRNHPSIVVNSLCNEVECINLPVVGEIMVNASKSIDPTRATTANSNGADGLGSVIDVQGFSHAPSSHFIAAHASNPKQPLVLSECCSCSTSRLPRSNSDECMISQNEPIDLPFVSGSLGVWTLFDYSGEPPSSWPYVSSEFGQLCFAGFPKSHAYWYTANWLDAQSTGRPPLPTTPTARVLDLLDSLAPPAPKTGAYVISTITSAASSELFVDGTSVGTQPSNGSVIAWTVPAHRMAPNCSYPVDESGVQCKGLTALLSGDKSAADCAAAACAIGAKVWQFTDNPTTSACWAGTPTTLPCPPPAHPSEKWVGGGKGPSLCPFSNVTLLVRDAGGAVVNSHTVLAPTAPPALELVLTLDVPSLLSGTGTAVLLDGLDLALFRVSLIDSKTGALVSSADVNVTFSVVSGPARWAGVGNGDPTSHAQPNGAVVPTFGGVARGVVVVNVDCVSADRDLSRSIDLDGSAGPTAVLPTGTPCPTDDIVVAVDSDGLARAMLHIPVSGDAEKDGVLAVARENFGAGAKEYVAQFVG